MNTFQGLGFYYHYKHDPSKGVRDYAYEVLNTAQHTEIKGLEGKMVVYRTLYDNSARDEGGTGMCGPMTCLLRM